MNPLRHNKLKWTLLLSSCLPVQYCQAQETPPGRLNFYIFTKDAGSKTDVFGKSALLRARLRSTTSHGRLVIIVAAHAAQVVAEMTTVLQQRQARAGNIWFDSHGLYRQGYSSFHIGTDEFSYKNICDTHHTAALRQLAAFCDEQTAIGIGSCYGGATFYFPGTATVPPGRMNGDSLMMGMGTIFARSLIYGSESWVMAKPGIFSDKFGFAGYPLGKRYRTAYWQPVWERLGQWNRYCQATGIFESVNTVALNRQGAITVRLRHYQALAKGQKAVEKNLAKLE